MTVLSEEKLCGYLSRVLQLSGDLLERIPEHGTELVQGRVLDGFHGLLSDLEKDRSRDSYLGDDSWNWIWKGKEEYNHVQLYGRLAWINLQLLELL